MSNTNNRTATSAIDPHAADPRWFGPRDELDALLAAIERRLANMCMADVWRLWRQIQRIFDQRFSRWVRGANE